MATYKVFATRVVHEVVETYVEADSKEAAEAYLEEHEDDFQWEHNGSDCVEVVSVHKMRTKKAVALPA